MGTITKSNNKGRKTYKVRIRVRGYPEINATFWRRQDAQVFMYETELDIRNGRYMRPDRRNRPLSRLIDRYILDYLPHKPHSESNRSFYNTELIWWNKKIGHMKLIDVTPSVIATCRDMLLREPTERTGRPRSPATVNHYLFALSHVYTVAMREWEWIEKNPVAVISKPKVKNNRVRYLSEEERKQLLEVSEKYHPKLYIIIVLALSTGARKMEILNMRWSDVDFDRKRIVLEHTKNGDRRAIALTSFAFTLMKDHFTKRNKNRKYDYVFPSPTLDKPLDIKKTWERCLAKTDITDFRFHDLRHCTASYLAMNGATLAEIAEVLGHKSFDMVKRYTHLSESHVFNVVENMNNVIFSEEI